MPSNARPISRGDLVPAAEARQAFDGWGERNRAAFCSGCHQPLHPGEVLGRGQFGTTRLATDKKTGKELACKSIGKRKLL